MDILDDCSVAESLDKVNPDIKDFWTELLKVAHPYASGVFGTIDPDTWHKNYKNRVDFASDSRSIFRHVLDIVNAPRYVSLNDISPEDLKKYINEVVTPIGTKVHYDTVFNQTVDKIVGFWKELFLCIQNNTGPTNTLVKDWNLDTGVDESQIDLWKEA